MSCSVTSSLIHPARLPGPALAAHLGFGSDRRRHVLANRSSRAYRPPVSYALSVETLTFLFTDIEGSTALLRRIGQNAYAQVLADHHSLIRSALAAHGGREVKTMGDGFFAVFSLPSACVTAVLEMQQALEAHDWPAGERVRVRMGVHTGEAAATGATDLMGLDVHRAARVGALGYGGQVLLSETAAALVRDRLPPGATLADLGLHRLRDLGRPEEIFQLGAPGLQAEFPPLRSLSNPALPNNLPSQLATFIGRVRELADVRALAETSRLVTLTGAGGCGKTRLSLQVAAELLDGSGDGVWLVELAPVADEDEVAPAIAAALAIAGQPGRPILETLVDALVPQNVLIVLDNCEHLIGACAKVADAILRRCPRVNVIATTREPLGIGGEVIYRVPSLSLPGPDSDGDAGPAGQESSDAVALLVQRARDSGVALPHDAQTSRLLASVCRRLDGMPLAIELAAARLRSMSLSDLRDRLDQRFRLLTGGSRTAMERQRTLQAMVDWSYSLLNTAERLLLRRLSVFPETFDLAAAEAVCGFGEIEPIEVADLLGSLADKSLVVAEPAGTAVRYRLLETIRQFAAERLIESGEDQVAALATAHCEHFLRVAETANPHLSGPDQRTWFARLDADQLNIWRAAEYAARDPARGALALRFGAALRRYWGGRPREAEALELLVSVLQRPEAAADPALFADALISATFFAHTNDAAAAQRFGEQAVRLARQIGDDRLLIEALTAQCSTWYFLGQHEQGFALGQEAVRRARQLGDDVFLGGALLSLLMTSNTVDPDSFGPLFAEAVGCTSRSGDQLIAFHLYNNAGVRALHTGDMPAARAHLEQAVQTSRAIGEEYSVVPVNLGWVRRAENDPGGARAMFETALRIGHRSGQRYVLAYAVLGLACLAGDVGDWHRAVTLHGVAQDALDRIGDRWQEPEDGYRRDSIGQIRARLSDDRFELAYAEGRALGIDDAVDVALGEVRPA
jgi:predicted ATPase/class 3 adenylate cyclase